MVGLVTANLCAQQNLSVALIDPHLPSLNWKPDQFDLRCSAISRASQNILTSIGIWENIATHRVSPFHRMEVWDALSTAAICFDAAEIAEPDLGHIIENSLIIKILWDRLQRKENQENQQVTCFIPAKPLSFSRERDHAILHLENAEALSGQLLIAADGAQSWLRQTADIKTKVWDYQQNAIVATIETERAHEATARQCFSKGDVIAFLPFSESHLSSIVWSTTREKSDQLLNLSSDAFCEELAYAFDYRLGKVTKVGERRAFPLMRQHASRYIDERIALVGDAAHVIHPLAGQGVNLGIYDAAFLVEVLSKAKKNGNDIGKLLLLRRYERARKGHNLAIMTAMGFFKQIFGFETGILQGLRGLAVNQIAASTFLKRKLMQQAMGLSVENSCNYTQSK